MPNRGDEHSPVEHTSPGVPAPAPPPPPPPPPLARPPGRSAATWCKLLLVWAAGLLSWTIYLIAILYLWVKVMS